MALNDIERAKKTFELLKDKLGQLEIEDGFVMKSGFISWLNAYDERIQRYLDEDLDKLTTEYVDEVVNVDMIGEGADE